MPEEFYRALGVLAALQHPKTDDFSSDVDRWAVVIKAWARDGAAPPPGQTERPPLRAVPRAA